MIATAKPGRRPAEPPLWPWDAPGMPGPGPDFLAAALALGDETVYRPAKATKGKTAEAVYEPGPRLDRLYRRALREPGFQLKVEVRKGTQAEVAFVPGHIWGQHRAAWLLSQTDCRVTPPPVDGPHPARVLVLGKMPWHEEQQEGRNLVGPSGEVLVELLSNLKVPAIGDWYVTNLVKFVPPGGTTTLRKTWIDDCAPLLAQELRIVRPDYILCLGADASKALLGKKFNVGYMDGRVVPFSFRYNRTRDEGPLVHHAQVMTVLHPAEAAREPPKARQIERGLARFSFLIQGHNFDQAEADLDHRTIDCLEDALDWIAEVDAHFAGTPYRDRLVAWDAEWHGEHPQNPGAYLRTVQASWAPKHAVCFRLTAPGGKPAFVDREGRPAAKRLFRALQAFCRDKRAVGHFLVTDLEWLRHAGFDPTKSCPVPLDVDARGRPPWEQLRLGRGWLDTMMMSHAIEETALRGLEALSMRYTTAPRYDIPLEDWKKEYCTKHKLKAGALEGYGDAPEDVLISYAAYDADVTLRIALELAKYLDCDYEGNNCWEPFWESMSVQAAILTMHENGVLVDRKRIDTFTTAFYTARAAVEERVRDWAAWPEFNIRSVQHVKEFLFGEDYSGKKDDKGQTVRIRPAGAKSLRVTPLLDTAKPPRRWEDLVQKGIAESASPTTGKMVLGILMHEHLDLAEQIGWVRDYRFLDQVLKSVLRDPKTDDEGNWVYEGEDDEFLAYDAGLAACIDSDGRVRTHFSPTAETGRWKSFRPNLQNCSKQRDADYKRLLGAEYKHKLRSIFRSRPGYALVEVDIAGAELLGMALMAGDATMIDHAQRSLFDHSGYNENGEEVEGGKYPHPQYYDIHSNVAVLAFRLVVTDHVEETEDRSSPYYMKTAAEVLGLPLGAPLPATKFALKMAGKVHFRVLAKNVVFGCAYGRGAKAIALQAKEQGTAVTAEEAQLVIDAIFTLYPGLVVFFAEARARATEHGWMCHCFGRFRRFGRPRDAATAGEFERQAMNFPIQGMVASALDRGLAILHRMIEAQGLQDVARLILQVHDALILEVRYDHVGYVVEELIPYALSKCVPIYPTDLEGVPTGTGPYYFGLEREVGPRWGEHYSAAECQALGLPLAYAK